VRDFVELMQQLAILLWQDLSFCYEKMKGNAIFQYPPFNDDKFGFMTFVHRQQLACMGAPTAAVMAEAEAAQARGDAETAKVLRAVLPSLAPSGLLHPTAAIQSPIPHAPSQPMLPTWRASDPATWPYVGPSDPLPSFAVGFEFMKVATLQELRASR
jgi:hypothetical protein